MALSLQAPYLPKPAFQPGARSHFQIESTTGCILTVGRDESLLASRAALLRLTGCRAVFALPEQAGELLATETFRLVVFCHSLSDEDLIDLAMISPKPCSQAKLLITCFASKSHSIEQLFDEILESHTGPAALLSVANNLLTQTRLPL